MRLASSLLIWAFVAATAFGQWRIVSEHGRERVRDDVSMYYLSLEIRQAWDGMQIAIPAEQWRTFTTQSDEDFAVTLLDMARRMKLHRYKKHPRGPKKKPPTKNKYQNGGHVSTAKLIAGKNSR